MIQSFRYQAEYRTKQVFMNRWNYGAELEVTVSCIRTIISARKGCPVQRWLGIKRTSLGKLFRSPFLYLRRSTATDQ